MNIKKKKKTSKGPYALCFCENGVWGQMFHMEMKFDIEIGI